MDIIQQYIKFDESFFVLVAFIGFVTVFLKLAWPKLASLLDNRADSIQEQLTEATRLREEAQATLAAYQKRQREVMDEAEEMLEKAKVQVETMKIDAEADVKQAMNRRLAQAKERITRAEEAALAKIQSQTADVSLEIASNVIAEMAEKDGASDLVDEAISQASQLSAA